MSNTLYVTLYAC